MPIFTSNQNQLFILAKKLRHVYIRGKSALVNYVFHCQETKLPFSFHSLTFDMIVCSTACFTVLFSNTACFTSLLFYRLPGVLVTSGRMVQTIERGNGYKTDVFLWDS